MGLLDFASGLLGSNGSNGAGTGLLGFLQDNPNLVSNFGAGLASGNSWGDGLARGAQGAGAAQLLDQRQRKQMKADNATKAYLASHPELSQATKDYAASNPDAAQAIFAQQLAPKAQASYGVIGEDAYGNKQYGWIDAHNQSVTPNTPAAGQTPVGTPADLLPTGVDPRKYRELQTTQYAKQQQAVAAGLQPGTDAYNNYMLGRPPVQQKPLTEGQSNAQGFAERMAAAEKYLSGISPDDEKRISALPAEQQAEARAAASNAARSAGRGNQALDAIPFGLGKGYKSSNALQSEQAQRSFINAVLRKESGAAISASEFDSAAQQYFPQPWDDAPTIARKAQERSIAIENMQRAGSNAPGSGSGPKSTANGGKPIYTAPNGNTVEPLD